MPQKLKNVELDEVSLVDRPANADAVILIAKRDEYTGECVLGKTDIGGCEFMKGAVCKNKNCAARRQTVSKGPAGVQFNIGFKREGGSEVQSVVFDSEKWTADKARAWLKEHNLSSGKLDETENTLRFRQKEPDGFVRFRMITPGAQASKALQKNFTWEDVTEVVDEQLCKQFGAGEVPYCRDLYADSVIFEQVGKIFRADYALEDQDGDLTVRLGDKVPLRVVYQDIVEEKAPVTTSEVAAETVFKLGQVQARLSALTKRL
jgi:hypothetical protein